MHYMFNKFSHNLSNSPKHPTYCLKYDPLLSTSKNFKIMKLKHNNKHVDKEVTVKVKEENRSVRHCCLSFISVLSMIQIYMNTQTVLVLGNTATDGTAEWSSVISMFILGMHQQVGFAHKCAWT